MAETMTVQPARHERPDASTNLANLRNLARMALDVAMSIDRGGMNSDAYAELDRLESLLLATSAFADRSLAEYEGRVS